MIAKLLRNKVFFMDEKPKKEYQSPSAIYTRERELDSETWAVVCKLVGIDVMPKIDTTTATPESLYTPKTASENLRNGSWRIVGKLPGLNNPGMIEELAGRDEDPLIHSGHHP